ncbi:DUF4209 domain-containing protein [Alkalihalobacillus sp. MEB130]|uniref:DUF4209 domain-containing protein n=1 Tax=Alkalihalobacillus sp. MEB130 TaxID=2976704 RepID=UPI0028DDCBF4|nr:DUF4209 domain-containing protein [Alkalihalobacillus sp. MEB130]MDT8860991.1 DUF4209 domain-containing protein [Alkalihalobacillus sp. MEB130]
MGERYIPNYEEIQRLFENKKRLYELYEFASRKYGESIEVLKSSVADKLDELKIYNEDAVDYFIHSIKNKNESEHKMLFKKYLKSRKCKLNFYKLFQEQIEEVAEKLEIEGIKHEKYGNVAFSMKFKHFETLMVLNTLHLLFKYKETFWEELQLLASEIGTFIGVGKFLNEDLVKLSKLVMEEEFFLASTFLTQIIERYLREIILILEYGVTDILKVAKYNLSLMLDLKKEPSLGKVFTKDEIETMEYFLTNDEYGLNLRNRLAHYNIASNEVRIEQFALLLHIFIFILVKLELQGVVFED